MARVRAGNTLANQYAPPFSVSDNIASGWHLRWNNDLRAFEAYDPTLTAPDGGFSGIDVYEVVATQNMTLVIVPFQVPTKEALIVTINGVKQHQDAYHINTINYGTDAMGVTFVVSELDEPIANDDLIEFVGLQTSDPSNIRVQSFLAQDFVPGTEAYSVSWVAQSKESLIVTVNGIRQHTSTYSITVSGSRTLIQFIDNPPIFPMPAPEPGASGVWLEVIGIINTAEAPPNPIAVANLGGAVPAGPYYGLFKDQVTSGDFQLLNFRSIRPGDNVTITEEVDDTYRITARGLASIGAGAFVLDNPSPAGNDPYQLRGIAGVMGETTVGVIADTITIGLDKGYVFTSNSPYPVPDTARLVGVRVGPATIILPGPGTAAVPAGTRIVIKDEVGVAGTTPIAINAASGNIDGQPNGTVSLTTDYASITVYTDGTNWFIIG